MTTSVVKKQERSFSDILSAVFPPPDFLSFTRMSIAVFPGRARFIHLRHSGLGFAPQSWGSTTMPIIPSDAINNEKIKAEGRAALSSLLLKSESYSSSVVISEAEVYLFPIILPKMDLKDVSSAIELRLEEYIPLPPSEVIFTHKVVLESDRGLYVTVSAAPRNVLGYATESVLAAGITPFKAETEGYALGQALVTRGDGNVYLIMSINETYTSLVIVLGQVPVFSATVPLGSRDFLATIARAYGVSNEDAVKVKEEQLFSADADESKFFPSAVGLLSSIKDEVNKVINYWSGHGAKEGLPEISKVILVGSDIYLPGVIRYFGASLKAPVIEGNVWKNVLSIENTLPEISKRVSMDYAAVIGAAL